MNYDQHIASDPAFSVWVSASAGTGKTKVLTDRVLRLLLAGAQPSKILCITFTKAAAAEMEHRIGRELGKWVVMQDSELHESLKQLTGNAADSGLLRRARQLFSTVLDASQRIRIQTIHGFCQSVLMRFPLEAGISPHFTIIDEATAQELLRKARMSIFLQSQHEADPCYEAIINLASLISEPKLDELLQSIITDRRLFLPWLDAKNLEGSIYETVELAPRTTREDLRRKHFKYSDEQLTGLRQACAALVPAKGKTDQATGRALADWLESQIDYERYIQAFIKNNGEPRKRLWTQDAEKTFPSLPEILLAEQKRVHFFDRELRSLGVAQTTNYVMAIAQALLAFYRKEKELHHYMDYDDLIHHAVQLLHRKGVAPWVLYKLDGGIDHLLVDEAQDTSPQQWKLVEALTTEFFSGDTARRSGRTLFVVGDEKQSIFSFQGAEPHYFGEMQLLLSRRIEDAQAQFKRVRLGRSFRSAVPVLKAVDQVFAQAQARDGMVFSEQVITHEAHRDKVAGGVEIWPLIEAEDKAVSAPWHVASEASYSQSPQALAAQQVADEIAGWLEGKRELASQGRPVAAGDIMILVQRRGTFASAMLRALKRRSIPVAGADRLTLTEHIAVMDCIALAEFLLLPQDDLSLAIVLKSPFIGLTEQDLFTLAYGRHEQSLWNRLRENAVYRAQAEYLSDLLAKTDYLPPFELFSYVLDKGGRKKLNTRLGSEVNDPLNEFLGMALNYGNSHVPSLQGFLDWLKGSSTEIKRDMDKGQQEVRILTVHAAKGLEAPIVFIPDATRIPRYDTALLWTQGEQPLPLWSPFADHDDSHCRSLKQAYRLERDQEYRRLLYVAMTRARDELYIGGWKSGKAIAEHCWYSLVKQAAHLNEGWVAEGDRNVLSSVQIEEVLSSLSHREAVQTYEPPAWLGTMVSLPVQNGADGKRKTDAKISMARERGILIHRMLQYLPDIALAERPIAAQRFIERYAGGFDEVEQEKIWLQTLEIIENADFFVAFSADSIAEAPVSGWIEHAGEKVNVSGQIDRLAVCEKDVFIIDYKTGSDVPEDASQIPAAYMRQMHTYRELVARLYPGRRVHCALLWTSAPKLMTLPDSF